MMIKIFLTIFLALALAVQGTSISIQIETDHGASAWVHTSRAIHINGNDLDDEQRGTRFHAAAFLTLPFELTAITNSPYRYTERITFAAKQPLFKLKAVFLI
ncbi:MAG: hypothetical protein ACM3SP_10340 [Chloroflexota bacterium]